MDLDGILSHNSNSAGGAYSPASPANPSGNQNSSSYSTTNQNAASVSANGSMPSGLQTSGSFTSSSNSPLGMFSSNNGGLGPLMSLSQSSGVSAGNNNSQPSISNNNPTIPSSAGILGYSLYSGSSAAAASSSNNNNSNSSSNNNNNGSSKGANGQRQHASRQHSAGGGFGAGSSSMSSSFLLSGAAACSNPASYYMNSSSVNPNSHSNSLVTNSNVSSTTAGGSKPFPGIHTTTSASGGIGLGLTSLGCHGTPGTGPGVGGSHETTNFHEVATDDVFKSLLDMYKQEVLCDVELVIGSHHIMAHKVILAATSPYFRAMFSNSMRESTQSKVELHGMEGDAVQLLIDFVYTHEISLSTANIFCVLCAANQLSFLQVIEACTKFLKQGMNFNNCVVIRNWAEHLNIGSLIEASDCFISNNFLQISGSEEFTQLPLNAIKALAASPTLNITCETEVFEAVMQWVKADLDSRSEHLYPIMRDVRLAMIPKQYLIATVEQDPVFKADQGCRDLLNQAKSYHLLEGSCAGSAGLAYTLLSSPFAASPSGPPTTGLDSRAQQGAVGSVGWVLNINPEKIIPRHATAGVLFCIGGRGATGDPFRTTEVYNPINRKWFHIAEMSTKRRHVGVCSIGGKVYAAGGHDGKRHLKSVEVYDTQLGQWSMLSPMQTHRRGLAVVSLGSAIFAVGGLDDSSCFDTVERYDTKEDQWTPVASMNHRRGGAGLVALEGNLYAIGGNDGVSSLSCCEKYDPYLNKWTEISSMTVRRAGAGIAVYGGRIFAAGGFDDNAPLKCVECYDPQRNSWLSLAPMLSSRGGVGLACLGGKLYAVGGHDGSNYLDTVETYDPLKDGWEQSSDINVPRAGAGVVSVNCLVSQLQEISHKITNVQSYV